MKGFKHLALCAMISIVACGCQLPDPKELHDAIRAGDQAKVKSLVSQNARVVNARDKAGNTAMHHAVATGNGSDDISFDLRATSTYVLSVDCAWCVADRTVFYGSVAANLKGAIRNHAGPVYCENANVAVTGVRARADVASKNQFGLRCVAGALTVRDFDVAGFTYGVMIDGGVCDLKQGNIKRSTTSAFYQAGGTLALAGADPVNQYGNPGVSAGTPGVSAPNQALLTSFAVV